MSRILNRPMFRGGGKVSSYGKGIASGLTSKPKRGLVDEPGGYAGISMSGLDNYNDIFNNTKKKVFQTGADVVQAAKDKAAQGAGKAKGFLNKAKNFKIPTDKKIAQGIGKYAKKGFGFFPKEGLMFRNPVSTTLAAYYGGSTPTPVDKKYGLENRYQTSGLSSMLDSEFEGSTLEKKFQRNLGEAGNPNNLYRYNSDIHGPRKEHPLYDPEKISYNPFNKGAAETDLTPKAPTGIVRPGGGDPDMYAEKVVDGDGVPELTVKEQVAKDKALFAELLGGDKAKGKDVSDMLLRFAGSGGNTVGEKFQQYIGNEAQAGPSRTEKINQAAASLAINDYIAGKRSKENMEMMIEKTKFGVDYTLDSKEAREDIKGMNFVKAVGIEATAQKKKTNDNNVIASVIYKQTETSPKIVSDFANENYSADYDIDETKLNVGFNIVTFKNNKIVIEKDSTGNIRIATEYPIY